jgi:hypothetical protein
VLLAGRLLWCCKLPLHNTQEVELQIISSKEGLEKELLYLAEKLADNLSDINNSSLLHAQQSVYKSDIDEFGSLLPATLQVLNPQEYRYWFTLGNSNRHLGVKYVSDKFIDIYCETP